MLDRYIGMYLYRISTWDNDSRQVREFTIIKAPYDFGDFEEVIGFDTVKECEEYLDKLEEE